MKTIHSELKMTATDELQKSVAKDLQVPDPKNIIAKDNKEVNENSKKYDRGTSSVHHIDDLFSAGE
jgi:hypothetical protein